MNFTKSFLALSAAAMLFASCKQTDSAPKTTETTSTTIASTEKTAAVKPETASFNIEGMTCAIGCAKTIEKELSEMDGVQKATVDFDKKTATVEFDATKLTPEKMVEIVEATADGKTYKVSNVKSSGDHAMLFDQEKPAKKAKAKKGNATADSKDGKPACCAGKKHCSADEKKG